MAEKCDNYRKLIICAAAFSSNIHKIRVVTSEVGSAAGSGEIIMNLSEGKVEEAETVKYTAYLGETNNDDMLGHVFFHELGHTVLSVFNSLYENVSALEEILYYNSKNIRNADLYHVFLAEFIIRQLQQIENYKYENPGATTLPPELIKVEKNINDLLKEVVGDVDEWIEKFYHNKIKPLERLRERLIGCNFEVIFPHLRGYDWYGNLFEDLRFNDDALCRLSEYIANNNWEKFMEELKKKEYKGLDFVCRYCQMISRDFSQDSYHSYSLIRNNPSPTKFQLGDFREIFQMWGIGIFANTLYINPFCDLLNAQQLKGPIRHSHGVYLSGETGPFSPISEEFLKKHEELENIEVRIYMKNKEKKLTFKEIVGLYTNLYTSPEALRLILATQGLKNDKLFPLPPPEKYE